MMKPLKKKLTTDSQTYSKGHNKLIGPVNPKVLMLEGNSEIGAISVIC